MIIRLKSLDNSTDVAALAREVVDKCKLIHPSKLSEVQHLISYLLTRKETTRGELHKFTYKQVFAESANYFSSSDPSII